MLPLSQRTTSFDCQFHACSLWAMSSAVQCLVVLYWCRSTRSSWRPWSYWKYRIERCSRSLWTTRISWTSRPNWSIRTVWTTRRHGRRRLLRFTFCSHCVYVLCFISATHGGVWNMLIIKRSALLSAVDSTVLTYSQVASTCILV